jgi:class 3 adenylate cyclase
VSDEDRGQGRVRTLTSSAVERAQRVVNEVLERAAGRGERATAWARIVLCGIVAVTWPITTYPDLFNGETATLTVEVLCCVGLLFSWWQMLRLRRGLMTPMMSTVSIVADAVLLLSLYFSFVVRPPYADYYGVDRMAGFGAIYLSVVLVGTRLSRRGVWLAAILYGVGVTVLFALDRSWNDRGHSIANIVSVYALLTTAVASAWFITKRTRSLVIESAQRALEAERARSRLGAYVSEEVAEHEMRDDELRIGGSRQQVAVLFADLRSFTSASENESPEVIVAQLNEYFEVMVRAIRDHGGVVDKYIGDSIMAVFGAPTPRPDDALRAIRAAHDMQRALVDLNGRRRARNLPELAHGIGVHYGVAIAGNIGTAERAQYTVIGDSVNVAARLESATKETGRPVLVSKSAVEAAQQAGTPPALAPYGSITVKGRVEPLEVFSFPAETTS